MTMKKISNMFFKKLIKTKKKKKRINISFANFEKKMERSRDNLVYTFRPGCGAEPFVSSSKGQRDMLLKLHGKVCTTCRHLPKPQPDIHLQAPAGVREAKLKDFARSL